MSVLGIGRQGPRTDRGGHGNFAVDVLPDQR